MAVALVAMLSVMRSVKFRASVGPSGEELTIYAILIAVGTGQFVSGWGLRKLRPWATIPAALMAALGLIWFPVGTLIGAYILYLLFSNKGRMVLSPAYADIAAHTPHLRYRSPRWIWITLILILLILVFVALFGGRIG